MKHATNSNVRNTFRSKEKELLKKNSKKKTFEKTSVSFNFKKHPFTEEDVKNLNFEEIERLNQPQKTRISIMNRRLGCYGSKATEVIKNSDVSLAQVKEFTNEIDYNDNIDRQELEDYLELQKEKRRPKTPIVKIL